MFIVGEECIFGIKKFMNIFWSFVSDHKLLLRLLKENCALSLHALARIKWWALFGSI